MESFFGEEAGGNSKMIATNWITENTPCYHAGSSSLLYLLAIQQVHWHAQSLPRLYCSPGKAHGRVEVHVSVDMRATNPLHCSEGVCQHASPAFDGVLQLRILLKEGGLGGMAHSVEGIDHEIDHELSDGVRVAVVGLKLMELLDDEGREVMRVEVASP